MTVVGKLIANKHKLRAIAVSTAICKVLAPHSLGGECLGDSQVSLVIKTVLERGVGGGGNYLHNEH